MSLGDAPRRSISELQTLLFVEPDLRVVFVEGPADWTLIQHVNDVQGLGLTIYVLGEYLDVGGELVESYGLDLGERGRALAAAKHMEESGDPAFDNLVFVVDRDFSSLWPDPIDVPDFVIFTDYASMEMYGFNEKTLTKLINLVLRTTFSGNVIDQISDALEDAYLLRGHFRDCRCGRKMPAKLASYLSRSRELGALSMNLEVVSRASINSRSVPCETCRPESMRALIDRLKRRCDGDIRLYIRAHDVPFALIALLQNALPQALRAPEILERAWFGCLEVDDLLRERLFVRLVDFAA